MISQSILIFEQDLMQESLSSNHADDEC